MQAFHNISPLLEELPYNLLIGPVFNPYVFGHYLGHPRLKTFYLGDQMMQGLHPHEVTRHLNFEACDLNLNLTKDDPIWLKQIFAALPPDWKPDIFIWWSFFFLLPEDIDQCPVPSILIVSDWHHYYNVISSYLPSFDYILSDRRFLVHLQALGYTNCDYWPSYSFHPPLLPPDPPPERDIDIAFVGTLNAVIHRERANYLLRLARLGNTYRVYIGSKLYLHEYFRIFQRSKIVFNYSIRGEMNLRAYEATACGAMLMMEESNLEVQDYLIPGEACVLYNSQNFEAQVQHYLAHEDLREKIARQGQTRIFGFDHHQQFKNLLEKLPRILAMVGQNPKRLKRLPLAETQSFLRKIHHMSCTDAIAMQNQACTLLEHRLEKPTSASEYLILVNALLTCQTQTDLEPHNLKPHIQNLLQFPDINPILAHNLATLLSKLQLYPQACHYFQRSTLGLCDPALDWESLAPYLPFVLPLGYTSFHLYWEWGSYLHAHHPKLQREFYKQILLWNNLYLLGLIMSKQDPAWALESLKSAQETLPIFPETYFTQAQVYLRLGQWQAANQAFQKGLELGVFFPQIWQQWLETLIEHEAWTEAQTQLQVAKVLFQSQQFETCQKELTKLEKLLKQLDPTQASESQGQFA